MKTSDEIKKEVREDICCELKNSGCFTSDMIEKFIAVLTNVPRNIPLDVVENNLAIES